MGYARRAQMTGTTRKTERIRCRGSRGMGLVTAECRRSGSRCGITGTAVAGAARRLRWAAAPYYGVRARNGSSVIHQGAAMTVNV